MTKLIVTPIDLSAPGSYRLRRRYLTLMQRLRNLSKADSAEVVRTMEEADELTRDRLRTDDDTSVDEVLDRLSAAEFDELLWAIAFEGGGTAVPPASASS